MKFDLPPEVRRYITIAATILASIVAGAGIAIGLDDQGDVVIRVVPKVVVPDTQGGTVAAPAGQVQQAVDEALPEVAEHGGKGDPLPEAAKERSNDAAIDVGAGLPPILAGGAETVQRGCRSLPLAVNSSPRSPSVRPSQGHAHLTVSAERPGWADVLAIRSLFSNPAFQASSHYIIDAEGNCAQLVPESRKAWTSGNMNPVAACNIEAIGTPDDSAYDHPAGLAKLARVFRDCFARWHIPVQLGDTAGCSVLRAGLVDHNELECGNSHWDICRPGEPAIGTSNVCTRTKALLAEMKKLGQGDNGPLTDLEARLAAGACSPKGTGHSAAYWRDRATKQAREIGRAHRRDGTAWSFRHRGQRRTIMARRGAGKCPS